MDTRGQGIVQTEIGAGLFTQLVGVSSIDARLSESRKYAIIKTEKSDRKQV